MAHLLNAIFVATQEMMECVRRHQVNLRGVVSTVVVTTLVLEGWWAPRPPAALVVSHSQCHDCIHSTTTNNRSGVLCRSSKLNPDLQMLAKLKSLLPSTWPERVNKFITGACYAHMQHYALTGPERHALAAMSPMTIVQIRVNLLADFGSDRPVEGALIEA
jgi:hypothetical protein